MSKNNNGSIPPTIVTLRDAIKDNNPARICQYLGTDDADVNLTDSEGKTLLWLATEMYRPEIVEILIAAGADVTIGNNKFGDTPLHRASYHAFLDIAQLLLNAGADIHAKSIDGISVIHMADSGAKAAKSIPFFIEQQPDILYIPTDRGRYDDDDEVLPQNLYHFLQTAVHGKYTEIINAVFKVTGKVLDFNDTYYIRALTTLVSDEHLPVQELATLYEKTISAISTHDHSDNSKHLHKLILLAVSIFHKADMRINSHSGEQLLKLIIEYDGHQLKRALNSLSAEEKLDYITEHGNHLVELAIMNHSMNCFKLLVEEVHFEMSELLDLTITHDFTEALTHILNSLSAEEKLDYITEHGNHLVELAIMNHSMNCFEILLQQGCDALNEYDTGMQQASPFLILNIAYVHDCLEQVGKILYKTSPREYEKALAYFTSDTSDESIHMLRIFSITDNDSVAEDGAGAGDNSHSELHQTAGAGGAGAGSACAYNNIEPVGLAGDTISDAES